MHPARSPRWSTTVVAALALAAALPAQEARVPTARVVSAAKLTLPGRVDSNNPLVWHSDGATRILTAMTSWGGVPEVARGASVDTLGVEGGVTFTTHPGHGVWFEAIVTDDHDRLVRLLPSRAPGRRVRPP